MPTQAKRRAWSAEQKLAIIGEARQGSATVSRPLQRSGEFGAAQTSRAT